MFEWLFKPKEELLPWYVNRSLPPLERRAVERWVHETPDAKSMLENWQHVQTAVRAQPQDAPPQAVWRRVQTRIHDSDRKASCVPNRSWRAVVFGGTLALVIVFLLWGLIRPGIVLQWSIDDVPLTAFRVYRARVGSDDFELVYETPTRPEAQQYTYVDARLLPGRTYVYRVEGVGERSPISRSITANGLEALPSQIAILLVGLIVGYAAVILARQMPPRWGGRFTRLAI